MLWRNSVNSLKGANFINVKHWNKHDTFMYVSLILCCKKLKYFLIHYFLENYPKLGTTTWTVRSIRYTSSNMKGAHNNDDILTILKHKFWSYETWNYSKQVLKLVAKQAGVGLMPCFFGLYKQVYNALFYLGVRCLVHCTHARADIEQIQRLSEKAEAGKVHIE